MSEYQPSIYISGLRIDEPITTLTDFLVSVVCLYAFVKLRNHPVKTRTLFFLRYYFLLMCLATFFGGLIGHAFLYALGFAWKLPGWLISMVSVAFIERSAIEYARLHIKTFAGNFFSVLNIIELVTIITITMSTLNFKWVEFHAGYGLLGVVLPFHVYMFLKTKDKGSVLMVIAVIVASLAALIFMTKFTIHTWFNHLDFSHVVMAIGAYVFYKAALRLQAEPV
jgi:hypothetical protein